MSKMLYFSPPASGFNYTSVLGPIPGHLSSSFSTPVGLSAIDGDGRGTMRKRSNSVSVGINLIKGGSLAENAVVGVLAAATVEKEEAGGALIAFPVLKVKAVNELNKENAAPPSPIAVKKPPPPFPKQKISRRKYLKVPEWTYGQALARVDVSRNKASASKRASRIFEPFEDLRATRSAPPPPVKSSGRAFKPSLVGLAEGAEDEKAAEPTVDVNALVKEEPSSTTGMVEAIASSGDDVSIVDEAPVVPGLVKDVLSIGDTASAGTRVEVEMLLHEKEEGGVGDAEVAVVTVKVAEEVDADIVVEMVEPSVDVPYIGTGGIAIMAPVPRRACEALRLVIPRLSAAARAEEDDDDDDDDDDEPLIFRLQKIRAGDIQVKNVGAVAMTAALAHEQAVVDGPSQSINENNDVPSALPTSSSSSSTLQQIPREDKGKQRVIPDPDEELEVIEEEPQVLEQVVEDELEVESPGEFVIYNPEWAPEFLAGSSTSPVAEATDGYHSPPSNGTSALQVAEQTEEVQSLASVDSLSITEMRGEDLSRNVIRGIHFEAENPDDPNSKYSLEMLVKEADIFIDPMATSGKIRPLRGPGADDRQTTLVFNEPEVLAPLQLGRPPQSVLHSGFTEPFQQDYDASPLSWDQSASSASSRPSKLNAICSFFKCWGRK